MGIAKQAWLESQERGWDAPDTYVCAECFDDDRLKSVVEDNVSQMRCDYCDREDDAPIAAPLSDVIEPIAAALFSYFQEPAAAGLPRDCGEWVGEERITDTHDALNSLPLICDGDLFKDIAKSFHNTAWYPCAKGFWLNLHRHDELRYSWEHFVEEVKHRSRFFFTTGKAGNGDLNERDQGALGLLIEIGRIAEAIGLVGTIAMTTPLFRVRSAQAGTTYNSFNEVGPPPQQASTAGRMNPAGISYLYVSLEQKTALAEVARRPGSRAFVAFFSAKNEIPVLDLTRLPRKPSVFEEDESETREAILFFESFIDAICQPVNRDGFEHIEYLPSQVVSEFFAQVFRTEHGAQLDGVLYPSTVMPGGRNLVIFPPRDYDRQFTDLVDLTSIEELGADD